MQEKTSLSIKLTITMILLVCGIVGLGWVMNHLFLEEFYVEEKKQELFTGFEVIEAAFIEGIIGAEEFDVTFERLCSKSNENI